MHQATLKSNRYDVTPAPESFIRNKLFVDEAKKYSRVLECGCSNGFLSKLISAGGSRVVGLDIDSEAAEQARRFCARVLSLDLNQHGWTDIVGEQFDLITFGDVLEHLVHPHAALREAIQILAPGGRVLICLPNIAHWSMRLKLLRGHFEYQPLGLLDFTHLRFFTVATARKMIEEAGYKIVRFQPVYGGMVKSRLLPLWQKLAGWLPNSLAIQMIFVAEPLSEFHADKAP